MFPLAGDKMKKEKKNYWKIPFNILIVLNVLVFCYAIIIYLLPHKTPFSRVHCSEAVNCTQCNKGKRTCQYYNDDMVISNETIECDCVVENEK